MKNAFMSLFLCIFVVFVSVSCVPAGSDITQVPALTSAPIITTFSSATPQPSLTPSIQTPNQDTSYKDIAYQIDDQVVLLINGFSSVSAAPGSSVKIITRYLGNEAFGDLNGDNQDDVVFILTQDRGGSGTFFYIVAALKTSDGYVGTNGVFMGDRIAPQSTSIEDGRILVNYADRKPDEPFTATPSVGITMYLQVQDGRLLKVNR